jgi:hypothetical protein
MSSTDQLLHRANMLATLLGQPPVSDWEEACRTLYHARQLPPEVGQTLSVWGWRTLLSKCPELAEGWPDAEDGRPHAGACQPPWDQFSPYDWLELLWNQPQFAAKIPLGAVLDPELCRFLLVKQPGIRFPPHVPDNWPEPNNFEVCT